MRIMPKSYKYLLLSISCLTILSIAGIMTSCSKNNTNQREKELVNADSIMEVAYRYYDQAKFNKSIDTCRAAMKIYKNAGDSSSLSDCYSHMSACFQRISINDSALNYGFTGLRIDERLKDKDRLSSTYNNLAAIYLSIECPREAKTFINKAIDYELSIKPEHPNKLSIRYGIAAEVYLKLNNTDSALMYISKSFAIDSAAADTVHMARRLAVMGDIYTARGQKDDALKSYNQAIEQLTATGDKYSLMITYKNLGALHEKSGNPSKALECLEKSTEIARECNARRILQQNYFMMATLLKGSNQGKAFDYLSKSNNLKDSIYYDATSDLTSHYAMMLESQQKQITIEEQQHSLTTQRLIIIATSIAVLLLLLVSAALFFINLLRMRAQRAEKNAEQMKDLFFTNVTHEFRTPLTVILGETEALRTQDTSNDNQPRYNAIINQGNHMMELVNQLLSISKVRSAIGSLEWHHGDIAMMAKMIIENMKLNAEAQDKTIEFSSDGKDYNIDFVPEYCHSIMTNLIANSLKFTDEGGVIKVDISRTKNKAILTISDNGCGIKSKDLPHIFELFYQGDTEKSSIGTGIGLSLVKQMTEAMNGSIDVKSEEGLGTTFVINIPVRHDNGGYPQWVPKILSQPHPATVQNEDADGIEDHELPDSGEKPIALIVDDNDDVAMYIKHVLDGKYDIVRASNGNDGLSKAREIIPDIIITDLMMPVIDGYEMCRQIRADELLNHIPIIIVTARSSDKDRLEALAVGADAFLVKPFNNEELKALVENLLNSRQLLREKFQVKLNSPIDEPVLEPMIENTLQSPTIAVISQKNTAFIEKVKAVISKNIDNSDMNSTFIADKMNLSQRQLNRKVKSVIGIDTASYIREVRISVAKDMLINTDDPVTEIAEKCGFDSSSYFSKIFKQETHCTPTEYRKKQSE